MKKSYSTKTEITAFFDHRLYLAAVVEDLSEQGVFSHRTFNRACGFKSPNFVQLVIQGKRNLSAEGAKAICKALGLKPSETAVFLKMREMNLATEPESRTNQFTELLRDPLFAKRYELSEQQLSFYSHWYNIPIRELIQSHPTLTAEEISLALVPRVPEAEVKKSLEDMVKLGLLSREGGRWKVEHRQVATQNEILNQGLLHFHASMIEIAKQSLTNFRGSEREVSAVTLQLTEDEFLLLREKIRDFKKEILASETSSSESRVFQFNFQLFPVTKGRES